MSRTPPPAAKPSQEWREVAHRNLRQEWRGTNHTTHQPQTHHTRHRRTLHATHHTPHTTHHTPTPPTDPIQEWLGTAPGTLSQEW